MLTAATWTVVALTHIVRLGENPSIRMLHMWPNLQGLNLHMFPALVIKQVVDWGVKLASVILRVECRTGNRVQFVGWHIGW